MRWWLRWLATESNRYINTTTQLQYNVNGPLAVKVTRSILVSCKRSFVPPSNHPTSGITKHYQNLFNLYKDSCPLIGWIAFIILPVSIYIAPVDKTPHCTPFRSPIALHLGQQECKRVHSPFTLECSVFPIQSSGVCSKNERVCVKLYAGQMQ